MGQLKRFLDNGGELPSPKGTDTSSLIKRAANKAVRIKRDNPNLGYPLAAQQAATAYVSTSQILSELGRRGGSKQRTA